MNEGQQLHMGTYSWIDSIDHMIKNFCMKYQIWKYWCSLMLHDVPLAVCVSYEIYLDISEGGLDQSWKDPTPCGFWTLRGIFLVQMLKYRPVHRKYDGDTRMRPASQHNVTQRKISDEAATQISKRGRQLFITTEDPYYFTFLRSFKEAKNCHGANSYICGYLSCLYIHLKSV